MNLDLLFIPPLSLFSLLLSSSSNTGEPYESSESSNESDSDDDDDKSEGHDADSDEDSESSDSDGKTFATEPPRRTGDDTNDGREKGAYLSKNITIGYFCGQYSTAVHDIFVKPP